MLTLGLKRLGKLQKNALRFYYKHYRNNSNRPWHSFSTDCITRNTINSLEKRNLIETNEYNQARMSINGIMTIELNIAFAIDMKGIL